MWAPDWNIWTRSIQEATWLWWQKFICSVKVRSLNPRSPKSVHFIHRPLALFACCVSFFFFNTVSSFSDNVNHLPCFIFDGRLRYDQHQTIRGSGFVGSVQAKSWLLSFIWQKKLNDWEILHRTRFQKTSVNFIKNFNLVLKLQHQAQLNHLVSVSWTVYQICDNVVLTNNVSSFFLTKELLSFVR